MSLADLGSVIVAAGAARPGELVDEALVNRHRYLDGTRRGSTRWVDTRGGRWLSRASQSGGNREQPLAARIEGVHTTVHLSAGFSWVESAGVAGARHYPNNRRSPWR